MPLMFLSFYFVLNVYLKEKLNEGTLLQVIFLRRGFL